MSQSTGNNSGTPLDGVRVVVVDDHPGVRDVITQLLGHYGAIVTAVSGVPEALEALARERPDVLIADIEMPGEDGYGLIRKVRALRPERGGTIPDGCLQRRGSRPALAGGLPVPCPEARGRSAPHGGRGDAGRQGMTGASRPRWELV